MINRKKLIYISIFVLLVIISIAIGTIVIFNPLGNNKSSNNSTSTTQKSNTTTTIVSADTLKQQAMDASKNNDYIKAKTLLQEARKQYEALGDTAKVVDIDAQLYYIDHKPGPPKAPVMTPITVEVAQ